MAVQNTPLTDSGPFGPTNSVRAGLSADVEPSVPTSPPIEVRPSTPSPLRRPCKSRPHQFVHYDIFLPCFQDPQTLNPVLSSSSAFCVILQITLLSSTVLVPSDRSYGILARVRSELLTFDNIGSERLGNTTANALPTCQLRHL